MTHDFVRFELVSWLHIRCLCQECNPKCKILTSEQTYSSLCAGGWPLTFVFFIQAVQLHCIVIWPPAASMICLTRPRRTRCVSDSTCDPSGLSIKLWLLSGILKCFIFIKLCGIHTFYPSHSLHVFIGVAFRIWGTLINDHSPDPLFRRFIYDVTTLYTRQNFGVTVSLTLVSIATNSVVKVCSLSIWGLRISLKSPNRSSCALVRFEPTFFWSLVLCP